MYKLLAFLKLVLRNSLFLNFSKKRLNYLCYENYYPGKQNRFNVLSTFKRSYTGNTMLFIVLITKSKGAHWFWRISIKRNMGTSKSLQAIDSTNLVDCIFKCQRIKLITYLLKLLLKSFYGNKDKRIMVPPSWYRPNCFSGVIL